MGLAVFVGCVSTFLNGFFYVFTGVSVAVIVFWVVKLLICRPSFQLSWRLHELPLIVLIAVLLFYVALDGFSSHLHGVRCALRVFALMHRAYLKQATFIRIHTWFLMWV